MAHSSCTEPTRTSRCKRSTSTQKGSPRTRQAGLRVNVQLIEQTRQLMERTIEFVAHPAFECADGLKQVQSLRPASLDKPQEFTRAAPGLAFVSGMVQTPLLTPDEERYWFTWMNFLKSRAEHNRHLLDLSHPNHSRVVQIHEDLNEALRVRNHIVQGNLR